MTKVLVIETALRGAALAFAEWDQSSPAKICAQAFFTQAHAATAAIHELWEQITRESGWRLSDVDAVIVDRGPGSFTGVKVGIAFAQALRLGTGDRLPCIGLAGLVARARDSVGQLVIIPANRSQGFFALSRADGDEPLFGLLQLDAGIKFFSVERKPIDLAQVQVAHGILLQPWAEIEALAPATGLKLTIDDSEAVLRHAISHLVAEGRRTCDSRGQIEHAPIEPLYISYSAPEEKILAQKAKDSSWPQN